MRHGSLFSGVGGFDLAAEWMGWENVFSCEINPFGRRVLEYYWPKAKHYEDITKTDFTIHRGGIDILTGGFPCQPFSLAGKRKGTEDDRHLWPRMLSVIREVQPRWVVGENVLGIVNWDGGLVFEQVQADLEAEGYEVQPIVLPACAVNAPHRRDRTWFIAYSTMHSGGKGIHLGKEDTGGHEEDEQKGVFRVQKHKHNGRPEISRTTPDTDNQRLQRQLQRSGEIKQSIRKKGQPINLINYRGETWNNFPTQPPIRGGDDGLPERLDGITFPKWRNESIKAYGNAVVPQLVYEIFKIIEEYEMLG